MKVGRRIGDPSLVSLVSAVQLRLELLEPLKVIDDLPLDLCHGGLMVGRVPVWMSGDLCHAEFGMPVEEKVGLLEVAIALITGSLDESDP